MSHPRPQPRPSRDPLHWPSGIPSHIQIHDQPIKDDSVLAEETKGWQQFLEENAPSKPGIVHEGNTSELDQRRHLVSRWASMMQSERDEFHSRAKTRENAYWFPEEFFATGPPHGPAMDPTRRNSTWLYLIDVELPLSPRNRALWTKMRILLSRLDGTDSASDFDDVWVVEPNPVPGLASPVTPERFQAWRHVENADFVGMAMSRAGRVIFKDPKSSCVLVDQEALNTGMVLLCEFESNGRLEPNAHARIRPWFLYEYWTLILGLGWTVGYLLSGRSTWRFSSLNSPLDMEQPILQVLEEGSMVLHGPWCQVEDFKKRINTYAPGYLSMEEAGKGMAPDYDHAKLVTRDRRDSTEALNHSEDHT